MSAHTSTLVISKPSQRKSGQGRQNPRGGKKASQTGVPLVHTCTRLKDKRKSQCKTRQIHAVREPNNFQKGGAWGSLTPATCETDNSTPEDRLTEYCYLPGSLGLSMARWQQLQISTRLTL